MIKIPTGATATGGMRITNNHASVNCGECQFDNLNIQGGTTTITALLEITGVSPTTMGGLHFNKLFLFSDGGYPAAVGLKLTQYASWNTFSHATIENVDIGISLGSDCSSNKIQATYTSALTKMIYCVASAYSNHIMIERFTALDSTVVLIDDDNNTATQPNIFGPIQFIGGSYTPTLEIQEATILRDIRGSRAPESQHRLTANNRLSLTRGTSGGRGVLKLYDAGLSAWRYAYLNNGAWTISDTEPT